MERLPAVRRLKAKQFSSRGYKSGITLDIGLLQLLTGVMRKLVRQITGQLFKHLVRIVATGDFLPVLSQAPFVLWIPPACENS